MAALKQHSEALKEEEIAVNLVPDDANKLLRLGRLQLRTERPEAAQKTFEKLLALPHDSMMENNVAYNLADAGIALEKDWQMISEALSSESKLACRPEKPETNDKCIAQMSRLATMLDTAGWVLYRQGKIEAAAPYLHSAYAISPRATIGLHDSIILARLGRTEEAVKRSNEVRFRSDFENMTDAELEEAHHVLGAVIGLPASKGDRVQVVILVDESGKVLDASGSVEAVEAAKTLTFPVIEWPEHQLRSVRTVELAKDGANWKLVQSFIVKPTAEVEP